MINLGDINTLAARNKRSAFLPLHGGDVIAASEHFGIAIDDWLDLSTGMNPSPYPIANIPVEAFHVLPYTQSAFVDAVYHYYGRHDFLSLCGSQAAIQHLPNILEKFPVLVPKIGYQEHQLNFSKAGNRLACYNSFDTDQSFSEIMASLHSNAQQHVVVIRPNNPTGIWLSTEQLMVISERLSDHAYLIVDEAFIDITPSLSLLNNKLANNIIVLRSFGKFFGLAGVRLGFIFAHNKVLNALSEKLSLWQLNGPAQAIAIQALNDKVWQCNARQKLNRQINASQLLFQPLMQRYNAKLISDCDLFSSYVLAKQHAERIYTVFATQGILLRLIDVDEQQKLLRIGLVGTDCSSDIDRVIETLIAV